MFEIGTQIRFKYTGAKAEILEDHMDGSFTVWLLDDEEESIAFDDDIIPAEYFKGVEQSEQQKQLHKIKPPKPPKPPKPLLSTEELYFGKAGAPEYSTSPSESSSSPQNFVVKHIVETPPTRKGAYLAFHQTSTEHYTIYLVNDTDTSFSFQFKLWLGEHVEQGFNKMIPAFTFFPIGEFWQGQFNDRPRLEFVCPRFEFSKTIKLKYKKFVRTNGPVPLLGLSTYRFLLFTQLTPYQKGTRSLRNYTLERQTERPTPPTYQRADLLDVAKFGNELDLHAEKLVMDTSEYTSQELFELQLKFLEDFVNKANELGINEVFIIHGLGKGKLREAVDRYLKYHGAVASARNEYHEKYGFGATKVVFK